MYKNYEEYMAKTLGYRPINTVGNMFNLNTYLSEVKEPEIMNKPLTRPPHLQQYSKIKF